MDVRCILAQYLLLLIAVGGNAAQQCSSSNAMGWAQHDIRLPAMKRGCHLITDKARTSMQLAIIGILRSCASGTTLTHAATAMFPPSAAPPWQVLKAIEPSLSKYKIGMCNVFSKFPG